MSRAFCIGVDVGGTWLRLRGQDLASGQRTSTIEVPVPRSMTSMTETITTLARQAVESAPIESVAVGLPGQVLDNRCVWVPNLRFLDGVALADLLSTQLAAPSHLINDAQATLLAEAAEGAARGCADVALLAVGTGIGGAYQVDGQLIRGANGCAGAFGWLTFAGSTRDEDHGQWERVGSGRWLEQAAQRWGGTDALLGAARADDAAALAVLNRYGRVLGEGIAAIASILDPDLVVFAGGLVGAYDLLRGPLSAAVVEHGSPAGRCATVVPAALGSSAGVIGALLWAEQRLHDTPVKSAGGQQR